MTDDDNKIMDLGEARGRKFLDEVEAGKYPALSAGYKPIEDHVDWYLENGYCYGDTVHAFAYSAAAQCFRDLTKDEAVETVGDAFMSILSELLRYGPHYGDEEFGGASTDEQIEEVFTALQAAVDRHKKMFQYLRQCRSEMKEEGNDQ